MSDEDNLFSRWSERKRRVAKEDAERVDAAEAGPAPNVEPAGEEDETVLLERLGLPVPETLKEGDDFSAFMASGVPEFLRKRALRVLWRSNPVLANLDGLNDYDEDFRAPELTGKVLATAYKVGRGILKEPEKRADDVDASEAELAQDEAPSEAVAVTTAGKSVAVETDRPGLDEHEDDIETTDPPSARPRRMRFES